MDRNVGSRGRWTSPPSGGGVTFFCKAARMESALVKKGVQRAKPDFAGGASVGGGSGFLLSLPYASAFSLGDRGDALEGKE